MRFLDKLGKHTFDSIEATVRLAESVRERLGPLLDRTPLARHLKAYDDAVDTRDVPTPQQNSSPFSANADPKAPAKADSNQAS
jgi:hypothetical protein